MVDCVLIRCCRCVSQGTGCTFELVCKQREQHARHNRSLTKRASRACRRCSSLLDAAGICHAAAEAVPELLLIEILPCKREAASTKRTVMDAANGCWPKQQSGKMSSDVQRQPPQRRKARLQRYAMSAGCASQAVPQ